VWEVRFHPSNPTHLFSCSNDGSLFHWDSSEANSYGAGGSAGTSRGKSTVMYISFIRQYLHRRMNTSSCSIEDRKVVLMAAHSIDEHLMKKISKMRAALLLVAEEAS
jgi:hypothetical protein